MKKDILIVGGYGDVGKYVVKELIELTVTNLVIGGRNKKRAVQFINKIKLPITFLEIDIYNSATYKDKLNDIKIVIMCLSPKNIDYAKYCMNNNIHYIDISPSNHIVKNLIDFNLDFQKHKTTCILGVGITPGLSTLLAKEISKDIDSPVQTNVSLMLGLGEEHGSDGVKWLLENLEHNFKWSRKSVFNSITPFMSRTMTNFPHPIGKRSTFVFNLSDQQIITETLLHDNVSTYLCYNSRVFTWLVYFLKRAGIFQLLKFPVFRKLLFKLTTFILKTTKLFYSDKYAIEVEVINTNSGSMTYKNGSILGRNNADLTGKIIAYTAFQVISGLDRYGVYYLSELFELKEIEEKYGNLFTIKIN